MLVISKLTTVFRKTLLRKLLLYDVDQIEKVF